MTQYAHIQNHCVWEQLLETLLVALHYAAQTMLFYKV